MISGSQRSSAVKSWNGNLYTVLIIAISADYRTWILKDQVRLSSDSHRLFISSCSTDSSISWSGCVWTRRAPPRWGRDGGRKRTQRVMADGSSGAGTAAAALWSTTTHLKSHLHSSNKCINSALWIIDWMHLLSPVARWRSPRLEWYQPKLQPQPRPTLEDR